MKYKHIFFDLDHTLWDFEASSEFTFKKMYDHFGLFSKGVANVEEFYKKYLVHNLNMWALYREGKMEKEILRNLRFEKALIDFQIEEPGLAEALADYYLYHTPRNVFLFPGALETLAFLSKKAQLHIITNGFEEVQYTKLETSGMKDFFTEIITSEEAGVKKPDAGIFHYALQKAGAEAHESLMVGDDPVVDIAGAMAVGMEAVFFNPHFLINPYPEVKEIAQLDALIPWLTKIN